MKVFLQKSVASQYIRLKKTKYVFISSGDVRDAKAGVEVLESLDVLPMLGMVVFVAETAGNYEYLRTWVQKSGEISGNIRGRLTVCNSWITAVSALIVWRNSILSVS